MHRAHKYLRQHATRTILHVCVACAPRFQTIAARVHELANPRARASYQRCALIARASRTSRIKRNVRAACNKCRDRNRTVAKEPLENKSGRNNEARAIRVRAVDQDQAKMICGDRDRRRVA